MSLEVTDNGIEFDWWLTGPQGARFCLYPVKGKHTEDDVKKARGWLYYHHDVVSIQVRWKLSDDKMTPPEKIPDFVIIKELRVEVGKLLSYIEELEAALKQDKNKKKEQENKELSQERSKIMKEEMYTKIKKENTKLKKEVLKLKESVSQLIYKINVLEKKVCVGELHINT